MSPFNTVSRADLADRHRQLFALAMLGVSLIYLGKATEHFISGSLADYLDYAIIVLAVLVIGSLLPAFFAKLRLPRDQKMVYFREDGYAAHKLKQSFKASWATTFISFAVLEFLARDVLAHLPAVFFIQAGLFIMLSVVSVAFLLLTWSATRDAVGGDS